jgi:ribosome-associated protein
MPIVVDPADNAWTAVAAPGAGGQNVNKDATAVHLRFDDAASRLPDEVKARLLALRDRRLTEDGVVVIKAQRFRTQDRNLADATARLQSLVDSVADPAPTRKPTRPTKASQRRRVDAKVRRGEIKAGRGKIRA